MPAEWLLLVTSLAAAPQAVPENAEDSPGVEMLEFLGNYETASGRWLDPTQLEEALHEPPNAPNSEPDPTPRAERRRD
ncbi:MAG TPA: hypothetical protein VGA00_11455 [Acidiferrobacterales bacterium]